MTKQSAKPSELAIALGLDAVIVAVTDEVPKVLTVQEGGHDRSSGRQVARSEEAPLEALPYGPLDPCEHPTLEKGLRSWVTEQTGISPGYVEQLYTFGDRYRDPRERSGGPRLISVAYLALVQEQPAVVPTAHWRDWYAYLPWEDWRRGRPAVLEKHLLPALADWAGRSVSRRERADLCFGLVQAPWDPERTLDRYELLYEVGLIPESPRHPGGDRDSAGRSMAMDHRRILATALGRLRGKIKYRPVVFELLPEEFTLLALQRVVEALAGSRLHKQNFRRLVSTAGLVEPTGRRDSATGGRPAELFRFRPEVQHERPAPGVHFSGAKW